MQTKLFLTAALLSLSSFASADSSSAIITSISPAQSSQASKSLAAYLTSLTAQSKYTSVQSVLATAIPSSVLAEIEADPSDFAQEFVTGTSTDLPAWYTDLPSDAQSYIASVGQAEISIATKVLGGAAAPRQTGAQGMVVAGAAVVGGFVAAVGML
ncbi:hypothetical protein MMC12_007238 [Toensbergia leucococca]|nr:hypothetical protein [Toensbergia leucococca]